MTTAHHERRLERGRRCWDLTSGMHAGTGYVDLILDAALPDLDLRPGHTVVDIGCGAGNAFGRLRDAVAPGGHVIGIDYSPRMIARARERVADHGWDDVEVRRADFTQPTLEPASVDRAIALSSLSAMPDVEAAVQHAHEALRPGGVLWVFDMKLKPSGWSTPLVRLLGGVYRLTAGWAGVDVLDTVRATFADVTLPDFPARKGKPPIPQHERGLPPWTMFVARKAG